MAAVDFVTTAEAAEMLGIDRSVLIRWVAAGRLIPVKKLPGTTGAYLFNRADIAKQVAERVDELEEQADRAREIADRAREIADEVAS